MGKQLLSVLLVMVLVLSAGAVSVQATIEGSNTSAIDTHSTTQTQFGIAPLNPTYLTYVNSGKYRTTNDASTTSPQNFGR